MSPNVLLATTICNDRFAREKQSEVGIHPLTIRAMAVRQKNVELSRRERQVMDIMHRIGEATGPEVMRELPDPPTYAAVRSILRILEAKGFLTHRREGVRFLYAPVRDPRRARDEALRHVMHTFFGGSASRAVVGLLNLADAKLGPKEVAALRSEIARLRKEEK
jgi:predicted transcriptional regulator